MSKSVLVAYATRYGSTKEIAEAIAAALREKGTVADIRPAREVQTLNGYEGVVLGAPLLMYHWHKDAIRFLIKHRKALSEVKTAVFALGPTRVPHDEAEWQSSRDQLDKELAQFPWFKPVEIKMLGGKFDLSKLSFLMNMFAGKVPPTDIRDWAAVRSWAGELILKI